MNTYKLSNIKLMFVNFSVHKDAKKSGQKEVMKFGLIKI